MGFSKLVQLYFTNSKHEKNSYKNDIIRMFMPEPMSSKIYTLLSRGVSNTKCWHIFSLSDKNISFSDKYFL